MTEPTIRIVGADYTLELAQAPRALEAAVVRLVIQELNQRVRPPVATRVLIMFGTPQPQ
jgi:hypothetical protein